MPIEVRRVAKRTVVSNMRRQIRRYELRYEVASEIMRARVRNGEVAETRDA